MGDDIDFVRALLDTYKASANETIKQMNLEELRDTLGEYDLSGEEQAEIKREIESELGVEEGAPVIEKSVAEALPELEKLVEEGVHSSIDEAIKEFKITRERRLERSTEEIPEPEAKLIEILVAFKTNPDGIAEALEAALPEEKKEFFADLIRKRLEQSAEIEAIDWATNVTEWQKGCEEAMGIPMYRTRYLKRRFEDPEHPDKYMVLAICYSPKARPYKSEWFNNVPLEDIEHLEAT